MEVTDERSQEMRIILAEAEPRVRRALRGLTTQGLGMRVVGEADTAVALERQVRAQRPDLAVVAWDLIAGVPQLLAALRHEAPALRVVVLGLRPDMASAALAAGADGFISKVDAPDVVARVLCESHTESSGGRS